MKNPFNSKRRDGFLLWALANENFYVKGHPAFESDGLHIAEGTKGVEATTHGENNTNPGTSADLHGVRTGSGNVEIVESSMSNVKDTGKKSLRFTLEAEEARGLKNLRLIELDSLIGRHTTVRGDLKFLSPNQVRELPPDDLIRYIAERDSAAAKEVANLYERAQEYTQALQKAFLVAADQNHEVIQKNIHESVQQRAGRKMKTQFSMKQSQMSAQLEYTMGVLKMNPSNNLQQHFQTLQEAFRSYDAAYTKIYQAARGLTELFTPQALSKLNDKQYVRKAAIFDENVNWKYEQWLKAEKTLYKAARRSGSRLPSTSSLNEGDQVLHSQTEAQASIFEKDVKGKGQAIDEMRIQGVAEKDIIEQEAEDPRPVEFQKAAMNIEYLEKSGKKAESEALRSADKFYKNNHILKSSGKNGFLFHQGHFPNN
ncbi:secreted protein [Melampsora americana]|nr:secreted protein [Melampsora americana]